MPLLAQSMADLVARDGLPRVVTADDGSVHVLYLDGAAVRSMLASDWPPPLPSGPTPEQSNAAIVAQEAARQQAEKDAAALRTRVLTVAQTAVGTPIDQLTAAQVRALVACLLYRVGALDKSGVVQPLGGWL